VRCLLDSVLEEHSVIMRITLNRVKMMHHGNYGNKSMVCIMVTNYMNC
jgi:hypothetical protein